jgi:hypothetical protein
MNNMATKRTNRTVRTPEFKRIPTADASIITILSQTPKDYRQEVCNLFTSARARSGHPTLLKVSNETIKVLKKLGVKWEGQLVQAPRKTHAASRGTK